MAEFAEYTRRELDFRKEARTSERVRDLVASHPSVLVPAVDWERTTVRVLTTDLVDGRAPAAAGELRGAGLDPDAGLRVGAEAVFRQIFEFGLSTPIRTRGICSCFPATASRSLTSACSGGSACGNAGRWPPCCRG